MHSLWQEEVGRTSSFHSSCSKIFWLLRSYQSCDIFSWIMQEVVLERLAGIKREYEELDTVWFMAGSLFKVFPSPT